MNTVKSLVSQLFRVFDFELVRYPITETALFSHYGINKTFDVGANVGQYAQRLRRLGYKGEIISFEPVQSAFKELKKYSQHDSMWTALNFGLGNYDGKALINIFKRSAYNSILKPTTLLNKEYFESDYVGEEKIEIKRLDSIFSDYFDSRDRVMLKIDTQGYEKSILEGAEQSIENIHAIQLELSFTEHYEGELLFMDMVSFLFEKGFTLIGLTPLNLRSGKLLQADGIFYRLNLREDFITKLL